MMTGPEVDQLALWCSLNNLELNTLKTVLMTVDFRRSPTALPSITILNSTVSVVEAFRFLGSTISQYRKWVSRNNNQKARQKMYFSRQIRKLPQLLIQLYTAII